MPQEEYIAIDEQTFVRRLTEAKEETITFESLDEEEANVRQIMEQEAAAYEGGRDAREAQLDAIAKKRAGGQAAVAQLPPKEDADPITPTE